MERDSGDLGDTPDMCSCPVSVQSECHLQISKTAPLILNQPEETEKKSFFVEDFREITEIKETIGSYFKVNKRRKSQDLNSSTDSFGSEHAGRRYSYSMTLWPTNTPNTHAHREEFLEEEQQSKIFKLGNTVKMLHEKLLREKHRKEELLNYCQKCEEGCLLQVDRMIDLFKRRVQSLESRASHFESIAKRLRREKETLQKSHLQTTKMLQNSLDVLQTDLVKSRADNVDLTKRANELNEENLSLMRRIEGINSENKTKSDLKELELEINNVRILYELALDRLKYHEDGLTKRYKQDQACFAEDLSIVDVNPCANRRFKQDDDVREVSDVMEDNDAHLERYIKNGSPGTLLGNRNMSPSCEADVSESDPEEEQDTAGEHNSMYARARNNTSKMTISPLANGAAKQIRTLPPEVVERPPGVHKSTSLPNESMLAVLARLEKLRKTNKPPPSPDMARSTESLPCNNNNRMEKQEALGVGECDIADENASSCDENYFLNISSDPDLSDPERRSSGLSNDHELHNNCTPGLRRSSSGSTFSRIRNRRNGVVAGTIGPLPLLMSGKLSRKSKDFANMLKHFNINKGPLMTPQRKRKSSKVSSMLSISQACEEGGEG